MKVGRLEESIYISDILYAEADGKRAKIHTKKGVIDASMSMADLEKVLPANEFLPSDPVGAGFHDGNRGYAYGYSEAVG